MAKEGSYTYQEDRTITLPVVSTSLAIEKREWKRLKTVVNKCKVDKQWFMSFAFCFFGIAGSAIITWISLYSQTRIDTIKLVLLITCIVSIIFGVICMIFQIYQNKNHYSSIENIKDEIEFIEEGIPNEEFLSD